LIGRADAKGDAVGEGTEPQDTPALCDILMDSTSRMIREIEKQTPTHLQIYSDMYRDYLKMLDQMYGAWLLSEKEWLKKFPADRRFMIGLNDYSVHVTDGWLWQIDNYNRFLKWYSGARSSVVKTYDSYVRSVGTAYSDVSGEEEEEAHADKKD